MSPELRLLLAEFGDANFEYAQVEAYSQEAREGFERITKAQEALAAYVAKLEAECYRSAFVRFKRIPHPALAGGTVDANTSVCERYPRAFARKEASFPVLPHLGYAWCVWDGHYGLLGLGTTEVGAWEDACQTVIRREGSCL